MPITVNFPTLGPVIGHVNTTSARLWLRGGPGQQGIITYASTKDFFDAKKSTIQLNPNLDYSGTVYLPELTPGNRYYYMAGTVSDDLDINSLAISDFNWSAFKKHHKRQFFETDIEGVPASFLFGSCRHPGVWNLNRGDACFKAINKLQRRKSLNTKFIIMCGDQVYADVLHYEDHKPGQPQKLSATPDLSGTVLPLCLIPNSALKSAPPFKSVKPKASACAGLLA